MENLTVIEMNLYQTAMLACFVLLLGRFISNKVPFFKKYCIPDPVVGGVVFAVLHAVLRSAGILEFSFETTLQTFFMLMFYTTVGLAASFSVLKVGGKACLIFLVLSIGMCIAQDAVGCGLAAAFGLDPRLGVMTGSVPMVGGHSTTAAFTPILEEAGVAIAGSVGLASATYGLVAGCLIGGPIASHRIRQFNLKSEYAVGEKAEDLTVGVLNKEEAGMISLDRFMNAMILLVISVGVGQYLYKAFGSIQIGPQTISFPQTLAGLVIGVIIRNFCDMRKIELPLEELDTLGNVFLSMFLGISMMTLKLWQLAELAIPMIVMLAAQTVLMFLVANFIIFNAMGRDYNAAVMTTGFCGFGMGASPNAMANMQAVTDEYGPAPTAILVVALVAALFIDIFNAFVISFFINIV